MTITKRDMMGGLAKGLTVIETFTADRPRLSISEVLPSAGWIGQRRGAVC